MEKNNKEDNTPQNLVVEWQEAWWNYHRAMKRLKLDDSAENEKVFWERKSKVKEFADKNPLLEDDMYDKFGRDHQERTGKLSYECNDPDCGLLGKE